MKQWKKMLLILMCAGAMSGLTGCGNNTNNTDDNAVNEVEDGVEDGVDDIVDDLDPDAGVKEKYPSGILRCCPGHSRQTGRLYFSVVKWLKTQKGDKHL